MLNVPKLGRPGLAGHREESSVWPYRQVNPEPLVIQSSDCTFPNSCQTSPQERPLRLITKLLLIIQLLHICPSDSLFHFPFGKCYKFYFLEIKLKLFPFIVSGLVDCFEQVRPRHLDSNIQTFSVT